MFTSHKACGDMFRSFTFFGKASVLALLFLIVPAALSQGDSGKITGLVTDGSGAAVANASVTVTNQANDVTRETRTGTSGLYAFPALPAGVYTITTVMQGFQTGKEIGVRLDASSERSEDFHLVVGQVDQQVVVTSVSEAQVNVSDAQIASTITGRQIEDISLNGRNYVQLIRLLPGAVSTTVDPFAIQLSSMSSYINGVRGATTLNMADGLILEDIGANISVFAVPNADSISEVRVLAANFAADNPSPYGGPTINVITKSGSHDFHGNVFEFNRNNYFSTRSDFSPTVLPLHFNDYGFTLGGPLFYPGKFNKGRNKLFFFASEEWKLIHASTNSAVLIPTQAQISGVFTTPVYQPGTKTPYAAGSCPQAPQVLQNAATGYCIPNSQFTRLGIAQLSVYPTPNVTGSTTTNYASALVNNLDNREDRYNLDYLPSEHDVLTIHFAQEQNNQSAGNAANVVPLTYTPRPAYLFSLNETHTFSPNLINTLVVGETHNLYTQSPDTSKISLAKLGVTTNNPFPINTFGVLPNLSLSGNLAGYTSVAGDTKTVQNLVLTDDLSYIKGRHTLKFGTYLQKGKDDEHGFTTTQGAASYVTSNPSTTGNPIGDVLLGNFSSFSQSSTPGFFEPRYLVQEYYGMDTWKATRRLSLEYGVRYGYSQLPYSAVGNLAVFNPAAFNSSQAPTVSSVNGTLSGNFNPFNGIQIVGKGFPANSKSAFSNVNAIATTSPLTYQPVLTNPLVQTLFNGAPKTLNDTPKGNFAPRVGFAYDAFGDGKTSVRGSYGIFFMRENTFGYQTDASDLPFNSTLAITNGNIQNPGGTSGTLNPTSVYTFAQPYKSAYLQTRSVGIQQQFARAMILEINYVGNQALHMPMLINLNQVQPGTVFVTGAANNPMGASTANINSLRPYKGYGAISQQIFADTSNYNSLQTTLSRRVGGGLNFSASYTFAKTLEGTSQQLAGTALPQNSYNYKADHAVADIHRSNVLTANSTYNLPFFLHSDHAALRESLGGWVLSGVFVIQSGAPTNVVLNKDYAGIGNDGQQERPNRVPGVDMYTHQKCNGLNKFTGSSTGCQYLNPAAFSIPTAGTFGNLGRNAVIGPKYTSTDLSLFKHFKFGERLDAQFRAESFNIFNRDSLILASLGAGAPPIGTSNVTFGNGANGTTNFGNITTAAPGRVLQFGAKLAF